MSSGNKKVDRILDSIVGGFQMIFVLFIGGVIVFLLLFLVFNLLKTIIFG